MIRLFVDEILFKHVDLVVLQHGSFSDFAEGFHLLCKSLIFVHFLHEPSVLLGFGGVHSVWPPSLSMPHSLIPSAYPSSVHLVHWQLCNVVEFDEVWVPQDIVFFFEVITSCGVEGGSNGGSISEGGRSSEFTPGSGVLEKLGHCLYNLNCTK